MQKEILRLRDLLGREAGPIIKPWGGKIPIALVFPNSYSIGMANLGFQFVYSMFNEEEDVLCERFFWEGQEGTVPLSVESQRPLRDFEIVAFSISFENDYPNLPRILRASGIPLDAKRRMPPHPLVWVGGVAASLNPEPIARFVDLFAIGEAEELIPDLLRVYRELKARRATKEEFLEEASKIEGIYVPSLYEVKYDPKGFLASFRPSRGAPSRVKRRIARDLDSKVPATQVLAPHTEFASMFLVEIGRGCPRRCLFCVSGHVLNPTRYRSLESLMPAIEKGLKVIGKIGLVSSSVGDHPQIEEICQEIISRGGTVSVSSLRLDRLSPPLLDALVRSGHKTLTLAPEAGSQRLRDALGKGIREDEVLDAIELIVRAGIPFVRMYFMVGLPTETREDVEQIGELAKKSLHRARVATKGEGLKRLTLSVNPFVPKPWTPFQWHPFAELGELRVRIKQLRRALKGYKEIVVVYEPPKWSALQALMARGDRRLAQVLVLMAEGIGWREAFMRVNLNPEFYLYRERGEKEIFPWDFIEHGLSKEVLYRAYVNSLKRGKGNPRPLRAENTSQEMAGSSHAMD